MMKKHILTFFLMTSTVFCYAQDNFFTIEPEFVVSNGFSIASEKWIFFNRIGEPRDTMTLSTFYFNEDGKKEYAIVYSLDMVTTKDSIVFSYDSIGRQVLQVHHSEIILKEDATQDFVYDSFDSLKQWKTLYFADKTIKISPSGDTTFLKFNEYGKIKSKIKNTKRITYQYDKNKLLVSKVETPYTTVYGRGNKYYEPTDTITTTYNEIGDPILTKGNKIRIDYIYENNRLITMKKIENKWGSESIYERKYEYNKEGRLSSEIMISNGQIRTKENYEYNEDGLLNKAITIDTKTKKASLIIEYNFE